MSTPSVIVLADRYDAFLLDLDGVIYRGTSAIPHAAEALARLRAAGGRIAFVTNNSTSTPEAVAERLAAVGIVAAPAEIETSALATAALLADRGTATAFVVGEAGIRVALADAGIHVVEGDADAADAVVVGLDRDVTYGTLRTASVLVGRGSALVATNDDASFPVAGGEVWPGAGALVAALETTTGVSAEVVGKPNAPILRSALIRAGGGVPLVIGDRLDTDVAGAAGLGWDSLLILTGITARSDLSDAVITPTFVGEDLRALFASPER